MEAWDHLREMAVGIDVNNEGAPRVVTSEGAAELIDSLLVESSCCFACVNFITATTGYAARLAKALTLARFVVGLLFSYDISDILACLYSAADQGLQALSQFRVGLGRLCNKDGSAALGRFCFRQTKRGNAEGREREGGRAGRQEGREEGRERERGSSPRKKMFMCVVFIGKCSRKSS